MKTTCAVSVATLEAPRSEIDTFAFFRAIESFTPSPMKQTLRPSACSSLDVFRLVLRQDLGEVPVHAKTLGEPACRLFVVARDDGDMPGAARAEAGDHRRRLGALGRLQLQRAAERVVDADQHEGMALVMGDVHLAVDLVGRDDALVAQEAGAADPDLAALHLDGDPVADVVLQVVDLGRSRPSRGSLKRQVPGPSSTTRRIGKDRPSSSETQIESGARGTPQSAWTPPAGSARASFSPSSS